MGSQARSQGVDKGDAQEDRLEQLAAHIQRDFRQCRIWLFETLKCWEKQLNKERYGDKIPKDEVVISPASIFNSSMLETVISHTL